MTNEARFLQLVVPEEELEVFCEGSVVVLRVVRRITMIPRVNGIDRTFQVTNEDSMAMISVHALCHLAHYVIEREREPYLLMLLNIYISSQLRSENISPSSSYR